MSKNETVLLNKVEIAIEIFKHIQKEDPFYKDLLIRLNRLATYLQSKSRGIKGAVRAYIETGLVKRFDDPLLIELETMLNEIK
ncbi:hypothetical protein COK00_15225 [Bacillus cereus]|uniref:Uncharacterized protein n=1 Tax=Bacillus cereus TaxID=1396 RepID=A0A2A8Y5R4_BACCE|nr:hypothetical protein [Bacillus cereus]PEC81860.1 hypothetical protein CON28_29905 [Bacillus cereus]PEQ48060.1 hypothetical protein CN468_15220 [Bacillus cereus]PEX38726.1 hypothetical protein CN455_08505 [Bacillus cereus]PFB14483.1 hypothetical protein CN399_16140 [Bacillus cereus]PFC75299.1 hypothetical protein CN290_08550 [Bacillus cereus]